MALFSIMNQTLLILLLFHSSITFAVEESNILETYIVHVDPPSDASSEQWYHSFLSSFQLNGSPEMVYTYKHVIKGFAAKLTPDQLQIIQKHHRFLHATPERKLPLHTTHSPAFLGLHRDFGFWEQSNYGEGVIIGVVDSGIIPNHPSFSDEGMPPPPAKWKGKCDFNLNFTACNNKLIGARFFTIGNGTPLDESGHGTQVSGIAAGNFVAGANSFGQANGTAVGVAPRAHLALYKVCSSLTECSESDILAAMDAAIEDGVDVLSLSLGLPYKVPFTFDAIALGAYAAVKKGIFVSCSAMNNGPAHGTLANEAPWILTVGASTTDRKLRAVAVLGNKEQVFGEALFQPENFSQTSLPLIYPGFCSSGLFQRLNSTGKIVICEKIIEAPSVISRFSTLIIEAEEAGAEAVIFLNTELEGATESEAAMLSPPPATLFPTAQVTYTDGLRIKAYLNSTSEPTATLSFKGTVIGDDRAPAVASFSSRGPSVQSPGILKPDILGPGVNILAAWHVSIEGNENRFLIGAGTSLACPHLSGVAALLKSAHPNWSPAAIKSAIMTTADTLNLARYPIEDQTLQPADVFATGAGQVNPSRANNPGLIYDIGPEDYIPYLCGLHYTDREIGIITRKKVNCSQVSGIRESQLNYPSFSILFGSRVQRYTRTVTNVGDANSSYIVEISVPRGVDAVVRPDKLDFTEEEQKLTYQVTFTRHVEDVKTKFSQGFLTWRSTRYEVRSPIVATMLDMQ